MNLSMFSLGGVALLRAAAKNHQYVTVITEPNDYERFIVNFITYFY